MTDLKQVRRFLRGMAYWPPHSELSHSLSPPPWRKKETAAPSNSSWADTGRRVTVADSLSFYEHEPWLNDVAVGASFAGAPTARAHPDDVFCVASHGAKTMALYALPVRPKGLICNDGARGLRLPHRHGPLAYAQWSLPSTLSPCGGVGITPPQP